MSSGSEKRAQPSRPGGLSRLFRIAVVTGVESAVRLHISRGDDVNGRDERGLTPLMLAASRNRTGICSLLLEAGAEPSLTDPAGMDALTHAIMNRAADAASLLEEALRTSSVVATESSDQVSSPRTVDDGRFGDEAGIPPGDERRATALATPDDHPAARDAEDDDSVDGWAVETERPPPEPTPSLEVAAAAQQLRVTQHIPVDSSPTWDDVVVTLPVRVLPRALRDPLARASLRRLLQRAVRRGEVSTRAVHRLAALDGGGRDALTTSLALLAVESLGARVRGNDPLRTLAEDQRLDELHPDPRRSRDVRELVEDALLFVNGEGATGATPMRTLLRHVERSEFNGSEDELATARAMTDALGATLAALASWENGLNLVFQGAQEVRNGRSLAWIAAADWSGPVEQATSRGTPGPRSSSVDRTPGDPTQDADPDRARFLAEVSTLTDAASSAAPTRQTAVLDALKRLRLAPSFLLGLTRAASRDRPDEAAYLAAARVLRRTRDSLLHGNVRAMLAAANSHAGRGVPLEDLIQEASIGMLRAIDRFDWQRGIRLAPSAFALMRAGVSRTVATRGLLVRLPVALHDDVVSATVESRSRGRGTRDGFLECASRAVVRRVDDVVRAVADPAVLDDVLAEGLMGEDQDDPVDVLAARDLELVFDELVRKLGPRPESVLRLRFGMDGLDPLTLEDVGAVMGVTRERVRQIEQKALSTLRSPWNFRHLAPWAEDLRTTLEPEESARGPVRALATSDVDLEGSEKEERQAPTTKARCG